MTDEPRTFLVRALLTEQERRELETIAARERTSCSEIIRRALRLYAEVPR